MAGKSVEKYIVHGMGKLDGKVRTWIVGVFNSERDAKPWVSMLKFAHSAKAAELVAKMDVHAPTNDKGERPIEVKYTGSVAQYAPDAPDLDEAPKIG